MNLEPRVKEGFTLIELLVVIVILSIIAGVSSSIFLSVIRSNNKSNIVNEIQQNGNFILQTLEGSLRNARSITIPSSVGAISQTLTYLDKLNQTVNYRISSGKVQKQVGAGFEDISNANEVTGVYIDPVNSYFQLLTASPQSLRIVLVIRQGSSAPGRIDYQAGTTFETTVSLRDY